jgi:hypothetical protein
MQIDLDKLASQHLSCSSQWLRCAPGVACFKKLLRVVYFRTYVTKKTT